MPKFAPVFNGLITYLRYPEEGKRFDLKPKSILSSFWLYFVAVFLFTFLIAILNTLLGKVFPELMHPKIVGHYDYPAWIVALIGPFLEEGAFRLSLNRKKTTVAISLILTSFLLISSFCFSKEIYSVDHLPARICIAVTVGGCLYIIWGKFMLNCSFKPYFWFWGLFFGCVHLMNVRYAGFLPLDYIALLLYSLTKIVMGLVLGYIRMKNSFVVSTSLHILNNLILL